MRVTGPSGPPAPFTLLPEPSSRELKKDQETPVRRHFQAPGIPLGPVHVPMRFRGLVTACPIPTAKGAETEGAGVDTHTRAVVVGGKGKGHRAEIRSTLAGVSNYSTNGVELARLASNKQASNKQPAP